MFTIPLSIPRKIRVVTMAQWHGDTQISQGTQSTSELPPAMGRRWVILSHGDFFIGLVTRDVTAGS